MRRLIALLIFLLTALPVWGATYYVSMDGAGAKDGSLTDPSAIATFNGGAAPYDDLADDTVYFLGELTTAIIPAVGGLSGHPATLRGDYSGQPAVIDGGASVSIGFLIDSKDYIIVDGFEITNCTTDGLHVGGTSAGIIVRNIYSHAMTGATSQAFHTEDTAQVDYYDIQGDDCPDDGFSVHGTPTINIYTGSFSGNAQGMNFINGPTIYGENISITNSSLEYIYAQGYHPSYLPEVAMTVDLRNVSIDGTGNAASRAYDAIIANGQFTTFTLRNLTVQNMPTWAANKAIIRLTGNGVDGQGVTANLYGINLQGNGAAYGILATIDSDTLTVGYDAISDGGHNVISGVVVGIHRYATAPMTVKSTHFSGITNNVILGDNAQDWVITGNIFTGITGSYYGINAPTTGSIVKAYNNTFYNSSPDDGRGVRGAPGTTIEVKNNIFVNLIYATVFQEGCTEFIITNNLVYSNSNDFYNGGTVTGTITADPIFISPTDYTLQSTSPCIDAGVNIDGYTTDYAGDSVLEPTDIGAYEYQGHKSTITTGGSQTVTTGGSQTITVN